MSETFRRTEQYTGPAVEDLLRLNNVEFDTPPDATKGRIRLIEAYNQSPVGFEGILVCDTEVEGHPALAINPTTIGHTLGRNTGDADILIHKKVVAIESSIDRGLHKWRIVERLGELGLAGAGAVEGVHETMGNWPVGSLAGGAAMALCIAARGTINIGRRRLATKRLTALRQYAEDPNNGAIIFRLDHQASATLDEATLAESRADIKYGGNLGWVRQQVTIHPARLVRTFLERDPAPAELWTSGFGEQVEALADTQQQLLGLEKERALARRRESFTGQSIPGEISGLDKLIAESSAILVQTGTAMARHVRLRAEARQEAERIADAEDLVDQLTIGTPGQPPHPLELHLQLLHDVVVHSLAQTKLELSESEALARGIAEYLQGCRELLTHPGQMEQFYTGILRKFGRKLPSLPDWEGIVGRLPRTES